MSFAFKPSDANTIAVQLGIDHLLSGFIIQNETITENVENLEIADQKGRVAQVIAYDKSYDCTLQVIGPVSAMSYNAGTSLSWYDANGITCDYIIQSVQLNCTYNDTAKYTLTMRGWPHASYSDKTEDEL